MKTIELKNNIFWVGAVDYEVRDFHGYMIPRGTSYNAYLIKDEKVALVDTVKKGFEKDLLDHVGQIVEPHLIDYLVINHIEPDHSGATLRILEVAPTATIICTEKGKEGLLKYYGIKDRTFRVVKTGETVSLGQKTLSFVTAPMVHWPDSMFTYCVEDKVLLSNDAFGQHLAHADRFADEIGLDLCMEEAIKYYANILMPLGRIILKKIDELLKMNIPIEMIGPSHGAIWRKEPLAIVRAYQEWAAFKAKNKVVIIYDTMWDSTRMIAHRLSELISAEKVEVLVYHLRADDRSQIVRDCLDAKILLLGSPTLNATMFWTMGGFLTYLKGLKPKNKKVGVFGSYGWAEAASRAIRHEVEAMELGFLGEPFEVKFAPTKEELSKLEDYAKMVIREMK